ncbi:hypothetical protein Taro_019189 [Colocasia esculenta]|uniref:Uncharacterized protein n=1 Tax=Colocasia esculenta TaxID=4460 RepID=A0A843UW16_COLES|nr:hypothetical protein [Colocasia esculenta]
MVFSDFVFVTDFHCRPVGARTSEYDTGVTDNIFCKGSVNTTISGVDTMVQSKGRNVKKRSSSVDTSPGQVDTREPSQKGYFAVWDMRSTPETSPRELFCQSGTVCRHTSWAGRHTPESL